MSIGSISSLVGIVVMTWLATSWVEGQSAFESEWTLERALEQAQSAHPDADLAWAQVESMRAGLATTEAARWPQINLQGRYMQTTNPMQAFGAILAQGSFDSSLDFNHPGQIDALSAGVQIDYAVYTGGRRPAMIGSARARTLSSEMERKSALSRLADAVVENYFAIRRADAVMASIESGIAVLNENLRVSRVREESGDLIKTERLNLEVELARMTREQLAIAHQQQMARSTFAFFLGLAPSTPISLAEEDPIVDLMAMPMEVNISARPEIQSAQAQLEAAELQLVGAQSGNRPTLNAFARADWEKGFRREGEGRSWTAGLVMSLPVFDGFRTRAETGEALARVRMAEATLQRLELSIALELENARLSHELALAQLEVTHQQVRQAQESADLSRDRFAAGTLLSTELIGVESRLVEAQVQEALATHSERAALAHYRRVAGLPIIP